MIEELRYAVLSRVNIFDYEQYADNVVFYSNNIAIECDNEAIKVYYCINKYFPEPYGRYLNKDELQKTFYSVAPAVDYFLYLSKLCSDKRLELYEYFLQHLPNLNINYEHFWVGIRGNTSDKDYVIVLDLHNVRVKQTQVNYIVRLVFHMDYQCTLIFEPLDTLWSEEKVCSEHDIDKILEYLNILDEIDYNSIVIL